LIGIACAGGRDMSHQAEQLKRRTMQFALDVCALIGALPPTDPAFTAKRQLTRAATSVAFNYRAACRARSHAEFTAKLGTVVEESDEAQGWLEFVGAAGLIRSCELSRLVNEAKEITAIMSASLGTAPFKERARRAKSQP
jgi:four helix bundle protein